MEELDLLKKDWKRNENSFKQISEKEIYKMLHKKSSSIVKWIFIISVLEIIFWNLLSLVTADEKNFETLKKYHIENLIMITSYIHYIIIILFIYLFYRNLKKISTTDSVKDLMQSILKTRKTVQYYVWYNLSVMILILLIFSIATFMYNEQLINLINNKEGTYVITKIILIFTGTILLFTGLLWLFYKVIYGFLLKKLLQNYKELKKIDF